MILIIRITLTHCTAMREYCHQLSIDYNPESIIYEALDELISTDRNEFKNGFHSLMYDLRSVRWTSKIIKRIKLRPSREFLQKLIDLRKEYPKLDDSDCIAAALELHLMRIEVYNKITQYIVDENDSVRELGMKVRPTNCLLNANISTIKDLTSKTHEEISDLRNLGRSCYQQIMEAMAKYKLRFKNPTQK